MKSSNSLLVRPSWRPTLSAFCTELTGITQTQVDAASLFPDVLKSVRAFLVKNGLIDGATGKRLLRFCWCSDGPFDIRDFVVKQCFISRIPMPDWLAGDVLDVRMTVMQWLSSQPLLGDTESPTPQARFPPVRRSLNISAQLKALGLPSFQGRQHSGIDDARNIARIVTELAKRGVALRPNTQIKPGRKWVWMGKGGQVLEQFCMNFAEHGNGITTAPPSPSYPVSRTDPATFQLNCDSAPGSVASTRTQLYGFGTAIAPASAALWSPSRPTTSPGFSLSRPVSPMSLISSSPDSEPEFGVMGRFNPGISKSVPTRSRTRHKRNVNSLGVGAVSRVGVAVTATCVS
ncbi:hypothetical protein Agabi119p4_3555 [Agaricus bisporus var. burnettii]|uniref:Exonuclease domain-containing protein n=1 Tax=Agaricus bisporus var. burnettii TaxID=192524 RepID=A0A8H7F507_AGABI|nr:hypothetical protein Agabi119p4_3555 [Agaricus bisporus var. burnettii]